MWVIIKHNDIWAVGFFTSNNGYSRFECIEEFTGIQQAMNLCHYLNGGNKEQ